MCSFYEAKTAYLVENYRSTQHVISAANDIIQRSPERLKVDYPIRVNDARRNDAPGGRWARRDPIVRGRVQVLRVPRNLNQQTQIVMGELERLKALDPSADWSDFAVLARTHATLHPVRAYCEWRRIPYLVVENGASSGQPALYKSREGQALIRLLRGRRRKSLRQGALARWVKRHHQPNNPWLELLADCVAEIEDTWQSTPIPVSQALEWIYEYGVDYRSRLAGRLNLSTVHSAKGREFKHVSILDGADWRADSRGEERRLYYVGMTRAGETLTLCEAAQRPNAFTTELEDGEFLIRTEVPDPPAARPELDKRYKLLGLADVDLGFAGRKPAGDGVHFAIRKLRVGDPLRLVIRNGNRELLTPEGMTVGRLSRKCQLPPGRVEELTVNATAVRTKRQSQDAGFAAQCQVEDWEVILCNVAVQGS